MIPKHGPALNPRIGIRVGADMDGIARGPLIQLGEARRRQLLE